MLSGGRDQIERWLKERENQMHGNMEETDSCKGELVTGGARGWLEEGEGNSQRNTNADPGTGTRVWGLREGVWGHCVEKRGAKGKIGTTAKV